VGKIPSVKVNQVIGVGAKKKDLVSGKAKHKHSKPIVIVHLRKRKVN
jgi:hypothetical protein